MPIPFRPFVRGVSKWEWIPCSRSEGPPPVGDFVRGWEARLTKPI